MPMQKPKPIKLGRFVLAPLLFLVCASIGGAFWSLGIPWLMERPSKDGPPTRFWIIYDKVPGWLVVAVCCFAYGCTITWWGLREAKKYHAKACEAIDAAIAAEARTEEVKAEDVAERARLRQEYERSDEFIALTGLINVNIWRGELVMTAATLFVYIFPYLPKCSIQQIVHQLALAFELSDADAQQFFNDLIGPCIGHRVIEPWADSASSYRSTPLGARLHALALSRKWSGIIIRPARRS